MNLRLASLPAILALLAASSSVLATDPAAPAYRKIQLSGVFFCEGATFGDLNQDGQLVVADANRDGRPDLIIGNKRGTALLLSEQSPVKK